MDDNRIVVYETFTDPINANIVKGLLDSYGIECFLSDENMVTLNAMYSSAVGGVKLNVFEKDTGRITTLLESENLPGEPEMNSGTAGEDKVFCPECHSVNVSYGGSVNKKFGFWNALSFSVITAFAFMIYPFSMRKAWHCFDCSHEFKKTHR
jgi:hypothetical protein